MAKFCCRTCGKEGTFIYDPERYTCAICDSIDVQFEIAVDELPADDPLRSAPNSSPQEDDEKNEG